MKLSLLKWIVGILVLLIWGCRNKKQPLTVGTYQEGEINISADVSFEPVIRAQIKMYNEAYPNAHINAHFKSEAACLKDLFFDSSTTMVIVSRSPTKQEEKWLYDSLNYYPKWDLVAKDAVAVIVHKDNPDTLFTIPQLRSMLSMNSGTTNKYHFIFDGLSATATYRLIIDSVMKGEVLDDNKVMAGKNAEEVLEYVATHQDAIGFLGISWIGNPEVSSQSEMLKKVQIASVAYDNDSMNYYKPEQISVLFNQYPLVRGLYYIVKENHHGIGSGFSSFIKSERGQLIFRRAYLAPVMELNLRNVNINIK
jgi:phosphate transport system substrate-binding protein